MIIIVCYKCSFCITSRSMMTRLCPALSHFILYEIAAFKMCHDPNDFIFQSEMCKCKMRMTASLLRKFIPLTSQHQHKAY